MVNSGMSCEVKKCGDPVHAVEIGVRHINVEEKTWGKKLRY